jgi:uncharacterized membrane protein
MQLRHLLFYCLLILVLAGLIHIVAVLALPALAPQTAWKRLLPLSAPNTMAVLPGATPAKSTFPFMAPDIRYAFCRFDLSQGPVRIRASVDSDLWLIALYSPAGDNFYTVTGADMKTPRLELIVADKNQTVAEEGVDAPEGSDQVAVVRSDFGQGIALIRAPLTGPSLAPRTEAALAAATCRPYAEPR